jgi:putative ABC transport system ATP-binding protein
MMQTLLSVQNVSKIYGQGPGRVVAVDDVSLEVQPGEVTLILGPSGSGKTTLLSILGCLLRPTSGQVLANGSDVSQLSDAELSRLRREQIGFVFQSFNLLNFLTVRQNVEVVLNLNGTSGAAARARATELLRLVGLDHRLDFSPTDLSGGERQRVAIARALANDPALILADEPTGNLDSKTGRVVVDLLAGLARERGRGVVLVTHDTRILDMADRVLYLADGALGPQPAD